MALTEAEINRRVSDSYEVENNVLVAVPNPLVSIRTSTYNHGPYIKQCIEGILMQKTNFAFEYIIGEDFSTDETREIVFDYAKRYPNIIRVITADYNVGSKANGRRCINACRGKYMAICEGDDYWIDPLKLQKQVDFLEKNLEYGLVHTDFNIINDSNIIEYRVRRTVDFSRNVVDSLLLGTYGLGTLTVLFRKSLYDSLPHYYLEQNFLMGDLPLFIEVACRSKIKYLPDKTACYRRLNNSASHSQNFNKRMLFIDNLLKCRLFYMEKLGLYYLKTEILKNHALICLKIFSLEKGSWNALLYYLKICKKYPSLLFSKGLYYILTSFFPFIPRLITKIR